jgi:hypothetical protein
MKQQAYLLYRAAVLIEKSERLYVRKLRMECAVKAAAKARIHCCVNSQQIRRCEEDIVLMWWEIREMEQMVPDTARYAA